MICPHCKLVNPPEALKCDCGYDFASRTMDPSLLGLREKRRSPRGERPSLTKELLNQGELLKPQTRSGVIFLTFAILAIESSVISAIFWVSYRPSFRSALLGGAMFLFGCVTPLLFIVVNWRKTRDLQSTVRGVTFYFVAILVFCVGGAFLSWAEGHSPALAESLSDMLHAWEGCLPSVAIVVVVWMKIRDIIRRRKLGPRILRFLGVMTCIVFFAYLINIGYSVPWAGFGSSVNSKGEQIPAKTLWDWLDLLVVPLFLALGAWLLDNSRKNSEAKIEADRQRQKTLEDYLECMTAMLLEQKLEGEHAEAGRAVARIRTLAALRLLDKGRKAQLLQFLYESGLIGRDPIVQLIGADLTSAELDEAVLCDAEVRGAHFRAASFRNATLDGADLRGSDFSGADFTGATMQGTDLTQAILRDAIVTDRALKSAKTDQAVLPGRLRG